MAKKKKVDVKNVPKVDSLKNSSENSQEKVLKSPKKPFKSPKTLRALPVVQLTPAQKARETRALKEAKKRELEMRLELKLQEQDEKIKMLEQTQKNYDVGRQRYGRSEWEAWVSGSEKGFKRSLYIDVKSMIMPRAT